MALDYNCFIIFIIIFPDLNHIKTTFPDLSANKLGHDIAYPAMLTLLPNGLIGLVSASMIAAFMSTISTQVNLGASYFVNDFYRRFIKKNSSEKRDWLKLGECLVCFQLFWVHFLDYI